MDTISALFIVWPTCKIGLMAEAASILRPARESDAAVLFAWRNDTITRASFKNTDKVEWDAHCAWLKKTLIGGEKYIFVYEVDGAPVGTIRFDTIGPTTKEMSWTVAPAARHQGIGKAMLNEAIKSLLFARSDLLKAEIKRFNVASLKIAQQCGFVIKDEDKEYYFLERAPDVVVGPQYRAP